MNHPDKLLNAQPRLRTGLLLLLMTAVCGCSTGEVFSRKQKHCDCCSKKSGNATMMGSYPDSLMGMTTGMTDISAMGMQPVPISNSLPSPTMVAQSHDVWAPRPMAPASVASCEQQLMAATAGFEEKLTNLEMRVEAERRAHEDTRSAVQTMNDEMMRLGRDVDYWKDEVRRIERTTEAQHRSDMASLKSISEMIDNISANQSSGSSHR